VESDGKLLVNLTRGSVVCDHVVIADRALRRMRGLLGRDSLPAGEGMLLAPAPSIHTAFMRFAIDVVFTDGTLRVKKILRELGPWRMASAHGSWAVVELAAGEVENRGIALGDQLGVIEVTDRLGAFIATSAFDGNPYAGVLGPSAATNGATENGAGSDLDGVIDGAVVHSASPKVLLVGADRRFRSVAAALLTRRECAVTLADRASNIAELAKREAPDVVVLDAGVSLTEGAHAAAQVETLEPAVGFVLVGDEAERAFSAMPVLPKWGSFEELYGAIERARPRRGRESLNGSHG